MGGEMTLLIKNLWVGLLLAVFAPALSVAGQLGLQESRDAYRLIKAEFRHGVTTTFLRERQALAAYPLYPELEYQYLSLGMSLNRRAEVDAFLAGHDGLWQARQLRQTWLKLLYTGRQWSSMEEYFRPAEATTALRCQYHHAQYLAGKREVALREGLQLWLVGVSQPRECDPLFKLLADEQVITEEAGWQRLVDATRRNDYGLAKYLLPVLGSGKYLPPAESILMLHTHPEQVGQYQELLTQWPGILHIVEQALAQLARRDAPLALRHWQEYRLAHQFDDQTQSRMLDHLVKGLYQQGQPEQALAYLNANLPLADDRLLDWRLQILLRSGDWAALGRWLAALPANKAGEERWQYWRARTLLLQDQDPNRHPQALATLGKLAPLRSFYGFLASDQLRQPCQMQHEPVAVEDGEWEKMEQRPGMRRAREHLYHQEYISANREWLAATTGLDNAQLLVAAQVAQHWQWTQQVILTLGKAAYWNDIEMRFPLVYQPQFTGQAEKLDLPLPLLFAVSRQESAFAPFVTSPAGARGLMQLMPGTALEVARRYGIPYQRTQDLFDPELNIRLGAHYYKNMLQRFDGNRILATAAYNAGPHRVARWLGESKGKLPFDAWIEVIPFRETRQYVQNVLVYSVIFAHRLGRDAPLLSESEKDAWL